MLARSITGFAGTLLALGIASAGAEPCSQEIMELTRKLAASDTGLDPTTAGTAAMADAQNEQQQLGTSAMNNAKVGTPPTTGRSRWARDSTPIGPSSTRAGSTRKAKKQSA